jgi:hypothetical protein
MKCKQEHYNQLPENSTQLHSFLSFFLCLNLLHIFSSNSLFSPPLSSHYSLSFSTFPLSTHQEKKIQAMHVLNNNAMSASFSSAILPLSIYFLALSSSVAVAVAVAVALAVVTSSNVLGFFEYLFNAKAIKRYKYEPYINPPHMRLVMSL